MKPPKIELEKLVSARATSGYVNGKTQSLKIEFEEVDPDTLGLRPDQLSALKEGEGVEDRSAYSFGLAMSLLQRKVSEDTIVSLLTDKKYFLGQIGFDHAHTKSRARAAIWVKKYCLEPAKRKINEALFEREIVEVGADKAKWTVERPSELHLNLEKKDLIEGLVGNNTLASIVGQPGAAKSFIAQEIGMCIARNVQFFGRGVDQGAVFDATLEGAAGKAQRIIAYLKFHKLDGAKIPYFVGKGSLDLRKPASVTEFIAELKKIKNLKLVLIDTLTAAMGDADQNTSTDMNATVLGMDRIRRETGGTVLNIHHLTKSGESSRGHGSHHAALDTEFTVEKLKSGVRVFKTSKQRDFEFGPPIPFELVTVELGENASGKMVTSAVVIPANEFTVVEEPKINRVATQALDALKSLGADKKAVSIDQWREAFYEVFGPQKPKQTRSSAFSRAKGELSASKMIKIKGENVQLS